MTDGQMMQPLLYQKVIKDGKIKKTSSQKDSELTPSSRRISMETPNVIKEEVSIDTQNSIQKVIRSPQDLKNFDDLDQMYENNLKDGLAFDPNQLIDDEIDQQYQPSVMPI